MAKFKNEKKNLHVTSGKSCI